ncbi:GPW/gp25 family protein [Azospirillum sp. TSH64]|uniref:GPW/gp25 family protein n=1 Tax=Azospirillum sp. TSH64 TaxID=652740 RepID=UPI0018EE89BC|nr:GPW/gp25 family protein [Azospirillum sp. TSH64]
MSGESGREVDGVRHLQQSIRDILTTPIGTRQHRREYGSELPRLVDRPVNEALLVDLYAATAAALDRWEPRLEVRTIKIVSASPGRVELSLEGVYRPDGREIKLEGIVV